MRRSYLYWVFSFFNSNVDSHKLGRFHRSFVKACGGGSLMAALSNDNSMRQIRHAYDGLFTAKKLNNTSLAMGAQRIPEPYGARYTVFTNGLSPDSFGGKPCLSQSDKPFSPAFLFTGDLPVNEVWESYSGKFNVGLSKHNIMPLLYQVPHHGSRENWNEAQRDSFDRAVYVLCARTENQYGHPHPEVLRSLMEENRATFWVTENRPFSHRLEIRLR